MHTPPHSQLESRKSTATAQNAASLQNWAKSHTIATEDQVHRFSEVGSVASFLAGLPPTTKVKVLGAGMSFLPISQTTHVLIDIAALTLPPCVPKPLEPANSRKRCAVAFTGATLVSQAVNHLKPLGLQLACCPGVLLTQTLGGALATGTHGQGLGNAGIYDAVHSITAILATGQIHTSTQNDPAFNAWKLHLGCLGVIVKVEMICEEIQVYRLEKSVTTFANLSADGAYYSWNQNAVHFKAWWFPETDAVQIWSSVDADKVETRQYWDGDAQIIIKTAESLKLDANVETAESNLESKSSLIAPTTTANFNSTLDSLIQKMERETLATQSATTKLRSLAENTPNGRFATITRFKSQETRVGDMYQLWCKGIPAPQVNCEISVPMHNIENALKALHQYYNKSTPKPTLHYPFILRATGTSSAWLSPAHSSRGHVCYIGFLVYLNDVTFEYDENTLRSLRDIEKILALYGGIPHFGKFFTKSLYDFNKLLPDFGEFCAYRNRIDPGQRFVNSFVEDMFSISVVGSGKPVSKRVDQSIMAKEEVAFVSRL